MNIEELKETNKRLNRKNQQLEKQLLKKNTQFDSIFKVVSLEQKRAKMYADALRDMYRDEKKGIRLAYEEIWKQLPKNPNEPFLDGFRPRVEYTLSLLSDK